MLILHSELTKVNLFYNIAKNQTLTEMKKYVPRLDEKNKI